MSEKISLDSSGGLSRNPSRSMQAPRPLLSLLIITLIIIGYKVILGNRTMT